MPTPIDGPAVASAVRRAGFTHVVWIPDSHLGRWEGAIPAAGLRLVRACREGEAVALAGGLLLGGAVPLVAIQCTGFFEAGDAVRNVAFDLNLPLKLIVGVRSHQAHLAGTTRDNCPAFAEPLVRAWNLPRQWFDPFRHSGEELEAAVRWLRTEPGPGVLLWSE
jgi:hypothetical protein